MFLPENIFKCIVKYSPLISIDLIVQFENLYLLGKRSNPPAKGFYFVPGGRIFKNETLEQAFNRISLKELGIGLSIDKAKFLGVFQHFYKENFWEEKDFSTHYIVLAYVINIDKIPARLPMEQHSDYIWLNKEEILKHPLVHKYTKEYFLKLL